MTDRRQATGRWGEETAAQYLLSKGYALLERNLRFSHGEIDLIAIKDETLFFIEVRTRSSASFGYPEDSVTRRKQAYLRSAAEEYLQSHPCSWENWQFDLIAVVGREGGKVQIEHFENILSEAEA